MFDSIRSVFTNFSDSVKQIQETQLSEKQLIEPLENLEMHLLQHNVAVEVTDYIIETLRKELAGIQIERSQREQYITNTIYDTIYDLLQEASCDTTELLNRWKQYNPALLLFVGANGAGKTTAIAKTAKFLQGADVVLAAGDTFRDASIEQLQKHADHLQVKCISQEYGSDAAAVIYDAKEHGEKYRADFVLADTAGRAHTNTNLMEELRKICRVTEPNGIILVVDATIGNDVIEQIKQYEPLSLDGVIVTKTDADTRGGTILTIATKAPAPIIFLGTGQSYEDLTAFEPESVTKQLLAKE